MRKLDVKISGKWFIALTIALGVVAMMSANNVIYLLESLLLSGLILSGVLSERTVSAVHIEIRRNPARAGEQAQDVAILSNLKNYPIFCIEIGEWKNKKIIPLGFIPRINPHETLSILLTRTFEKRGIHKWEGLALSTAYPYGFAKKTKIIYSTGERIIWPSLDKKQSHKKNLDFNALRARIGQEVSEGEVRSYNYDDDSSMIVWTLSARGVDPVVRTRKSGNPSPDAIIDLRSKPGENFEKLIISTALPFYLTGADRQDGILTVIDFKGRRRISGKERALNFLAQAQALGTREDAA